MADEQRTFEAALRDLYECSDCHGLVSARDSHDCPRTMGIEVHSTRAFYALLAKSRKHH